jgi:hypothetical protein
MVWVQMGGNCGTRLSGAGGSPRTAVPGRVQGRLGKRERERERERGRREQAGEAGWWAGPQGGAHLSVGRGYDRWVRAGKRKERKRKQNQFEFEIDTSNLLKLDLIQTGLSQTQKI